MYGNYITFTPTHTLFLLTNHLPRFTEWNSAMARRVQIIPWEVSIPPEEQRPQTEVVEELLTEADNILGWILQGWVDWVRNPGWTCTKVHAVTTDYNEQQDHLGAFLRDCTENPGKKVSADDLYRRFSQWCDACGIEPWTKTCFTRHLSQRLSTQRSNGTRWWLDITLRNPDTGAELTHSEAVPGGVNPKWCGSGEN